MRSAANGQMSSSKCCDELRGDLRNNQDDSSAGGPVAAREMGIFKLMEPKADKLSSFSILKAAQTLGERVYEVLEEAIVDGVIAQGSHLREDEIAKQLGVSRNPVREALQRLMHDGFVEHRAGRGAFVHAPSEREVLEVFHARSLLESECARLAAGHISGLELSQLEELLGLGEAAIEEQDAHLLLQLNDRFHKIIVVASDNSVIARMMVILQRRIRWYFFQVVVTRAPGSWDQHRKIYEALRQRDGDRAAACMVAHVMQTAATIREQQGAPGNAIRAVRS